MAPEKSNEKTTEKIYKFYTEDLRIRASAAVTTEVVRTMCDSQNLFPLGATAWAGR